VARHDIELAEGAVSAGEARVRSLRALEDYLVVRAPFEGVVAERNVHPGALVGPSVSGSVPMFRLDQVSRLRLTVAVPEEHLSGLAAGAPAQFTVKAWSGRVFTGVIRRPSFSVDVRTRTMPVELDVANLDGALAPGMYAEIRWPVTRPYASLLVPPTALVQTPEKLFVDRVKDGTVEQVPVSRGKAVKDAVEVVGPLAAGDWVLRRGSEELKDGAKVATRPAEPGPAGAR
jgi:RND family efflux transporter MFP subunit